MTEIIAEISGNHNGRLYDALHLIEAAKECDCDGVKIQLYRAEDMPDDGGDYERLAVPENWLNELFNHARDCAIPLYSSVFAVWAVNTLEHYGCEGYKIASPESTRLTEHRYRELMEAIYETGQRYMVSSGRADMKFMRSWPSRMCCFSARLVIRPVITDEDMSYMADLAVSPLINQVVTIVGFSDHTVGFHSTMAMIGAGAKVIEKHFKLDDDCVDAAFSLNKDQMRRLCEIVA